MKLDQARRRAVEIVNGAKDGKDVLAERGGRQGGDGGHPRPADRRLPRAPGPAAPAAAHVSSRRSIICVRRWAPLHGKAGRQHHPPGRRRQLERIRSAWPGGRPQRPGLLSGCFSWAIKAGLRGANPMIGTEAPAATDRGRVLKPEELSPIWHACGDDDSGASSSCSCCPARGARKSRTWRGRSSISSAGLDHPGRQVEEPP